MRRRRPRKVNYDELYLYFARERSNLERSEIERSFFTHHTHWTTIVGTSCGMLLHRPPLHREIHYRRSPLNSVKFAKTCGDGHHYSFLVLEDHWSELSPVIFTDPCLGGINIVAAENLTEFLRLGIRWGYFSLFSQVPMPESGVYDFSSLEEIEQNECTEWTEPDQESALRMLAERFGLTPLENVVDRLTELQHIYQPLIQPAPDDRPSLDTVAAARRELAREQFQPGDVVIWEKNVGGFFQPVKATVIAIHARRVTISADDPDETGAGTVTRSVAPTNLRLLEQISVDPPPSRSVSKHRRRR